MKKALALLLALSMALCFCACGDKEEKSGDVPEFDGLKYEETVETEHATEFKIYRYQGGYSYITINNGDNIMVVPEGKKAPKDLAKDVVVIQQPVDHIYLPATSVMAHFNGMDALDYVKYSGLETGEWSTEEANKAMEEGKIVYAGHYSAPDYEILIGGGCDLAIESTMIYHTPEVKEKLEELGIPVMVERSTYEDHPLGRTEWIKLFGEIIGLPEKAKAAYDVQSEIIKNLGEQPNTGKTVAFFYVNSRGNVVTYAGEGYIPSMIRLAGGEYALKDLQSDSKLSSINMSMEEFYNRAVDADIIIYNSSIAAEIYTLEQFYDLSNVLSSFKASKNGEVWCTSKSMYQETDKMGSIIEDMNKIILGTAGDGESLNYIHRLK
ncbi:MAG: ABC transporter substrate-binding protein [Firmicutes bacterium]|nr:ABC transporter substrate-binding protein [Bacillota bacterium]